jgi:hypothetical protein
MVEMSLFEENFMTRTLAAPFLAVVAVAALVACGGSRSGPNGLSQSMELPVVDGNLAITAVLPAHTIGVGYPPDIGHVLSKFWKADVAGYTQSGRSQVLGFPPGTQLKITNISKGTEDHTLNVIKKISHPPASFPKNPTLLFTPSGGHELITGYRSGTIKPGMSVTVTLHKGIFLIGCAYHYLSNGMHDVIVVSAGATPGPTATP